MAFTGGVKNGGFYRKNAAGKLLRIRDAKPKRDVKVKPAPAHKPDPESEFLRNLGDPTRGLTGKTIGTVANRLVDTAYKPRLDELDRADTQTIAQRKQQQDWMAQYGKQAGGIFGGMTGAQTTANTQANEATAARRTQLLGAVGQQPRPQDTRGEGLDGGAAGLLAADAQQLTSRAALQADTNAQATRSQGDAQAALLRALSGAQQLGIQEEQGAIGRRAGEALAENADTRRGLAENRGNELAKTLVGLREGEVDRYMTERALGSKEQQALLDAQADIAAAQTKAQMAAAERRHEVRLKAMGLDSSEARDEARYVFQAEQNRLGREQSDRNSRRSAAGKDPKKKGLTTSQRRTYADSRDRAFGSARALKAQGVGGKDARSALSAKEGHNALFVQAAIEKFWGGRGVTPATAKKIKERYGIDIPRALK